MDFTWLIERSSFPICAFFTLASLFFEEIITACSVVILGAYFKIIANICTAIQLFLFAVT